MNVRKGTQSSPINTPQVSVCVITYNQVNYIRQCLKSILDQKTEFYFEVIVGDDCSTDGTLEVVREFAHKHPEIVKLVYQEKNVGWVGNYAATRNLATGKYIAHLDGDDFALPGKLQRQYDIFEANANCVLVSHDMKLLSSGGSPLSRTFRRHRAGRNTLLDLYQELPFFAHSSKMVRSDVDKGVLREAAKHTIDVELHVKMAKQGDIFHIDEPLGVYRTGVGIATKADCVSPTLVAASRRIFKRALEDCHGNRDTIRAAYAKNMFKFAYQAALQGNKKQLREFIRESVKQKIISASQVLLLVLSAVPALVFYLVSLRSAARYRLEISSR